MNDLRLALVFAAGLLICQPGYAQPASLPMNTPVRIAGVETVCTGVSLDDRLFVFHDPNLGKPRRR